VKSGGGLQSRTWLDLHFASFSRGGETRRGSQPASVNIPTAADAFGEIDRLSAQMLSTGDRSDAIELVVVDREGQVVGRPGVH
jgi:hypothetical protein